MESSARSGVPGFSQAHCGGVLCQDPQTEFALLRERLGVSRINLGALFAAKPRIQAMTGLLPKQPLETPQPRLSDSAPEGPAREPTTGTWRDLQHSRSHAGHYARVSRCGVNLADPGITTELRGLTPSQSRPADIFATLDAAVPGRSAALDVCGLLPMQQRLEETQRRRRLIANCPTMKSQTSVTRHGRPLVWTAEQQTSHPAAARFSSNFTSGCQSQATGSALQFPL